MSRISLNAGSYHRVPNSLKIARGCQNLNRAVIVGNDILCTCIDGCFHHSIFVAASREHELPDVIKQVIYRAVGAKIAAKLAVGYRLHELPNDITRETMACFEPTIDYVVTKVPRFAFEKFPEANADLTTQMKSVGETMAIGRTFKESFQKALRGLEVGSFGFGCDRNDLWGTPQQPGLDDVV